MSTHRQKLNKGVFTKQIFTTKIPKGFFAKEFCIFFVMNKVEK